MIMVANFLEIESLLNITSAKIASLIQKNPEEIKDSLNISNISNIKK